MKNYRLQRQLKSQGASAKDAKALSGVAQTVSKTELPGLSAEAKKRIAAEIGIESSPWAFFTVPRLAIGGALALFALLIGFSQAALPGSPLYSIKRGTEEVRLLLQPGFTQQDVEDRRADEQRRLGNTNSTKTDDSSNDVNEDNHDGTSEDSHKSGTESGDDKSGSNTSGSGDTGGSGTSGSNTSGSSGGSGTSSGSGSSGGSGSNSGSSGGSGSNSGSSGGSGSNSGGSGGGGSGGHGSDD